MGMKARSAYFINKNAGGPFSKQDQIKYKLNLQLFAKMPKGRSQIMHIMVDRKGHLPDTLANRKILEAVSNDKNNFIMADSRGFNVYSKIINGREYWVYERNGIIQNGGVNKEKFRYHKQGEIKND